ncbi:MAG: aldehyde dehydrogenase [Eubacterium sp.]|nr:aldehyde dehydrogenase [Eubacterium sp.]
MEMLINGKHTGSLSGQTMDVYDPYRGTVLDTVPRATEADLDLALDAAKEAQKEWKKVPVHQRAAILMKFVELVQANKQSLAETLCRDNGKPITQALGEIGNIQTVVPAFVEKAKHFYETVVPAGLESGQENAIQYIKREPVGVVACIIPFNFPSNLFCQKVMPSLLMGNAALVLPPSGNPLTVMRLCDLLAEAGIPAGVIQCVTAPGAMKEYAVRDPRTDFISLTGSTETGVRTAQVAAASLKPYALELGGNDPFVVFEDANMDIAVGEIFGGRLTNSGQICCACKRFLIHRSRLAEFTEKTLAMVNSLKIGDPMDPSTQISCLINEKEAITVEEQVKHTLSQGGRLLCGGERKGTHYAPTVIADVTPDMDIASDLEVFGPVIPIIPFDTMEEAIEIANNSIYGLSSCVFTENMHTVKKMVDAFEAGNVIVNSASRLRTFEMPFGGWKMSGVGTEGVMVTFNEVTKPKVVVLTNL